MTLGQKISYLRTMRNLSQEQLAEQLGVSRQSVSKWESDQSLPEINKIVLLSSLFEVSTDELLKSDITLKVQIESNENVSLGEFKGKYFGTDGFRGEANVDLTAIHAFKIGRFLGWYYQKNFHSNNFKNVRIVVGKDTRRSSYMLEYAIVSGIIASGADAYMLHVTTTPSVAYVVRQEKFDCGIMISASHNPFYDNGIKLLNGNGEKMDDDTLALIEKYIDGEFVLEENAELPFAYREKIGSVIDFVAGRNRYVGFLISVAANSYKRLKIAIDCANGASWMIAKSVFGALGADVYAINDNPNGLNINQNCGATDISSLQKYVRENCCDVGFAFDGDADRCIAVDEKGNEINGDHILYILSKRLQDKGQLPNKKIATTVMSNMGLYKALEKDGIGYIQTAVGDRYVHDEMQKQDIYLGGEQSGHIIVRKYATTGDGILTAILLLEEMIDKKTSISALAEPMTMFPQYILNVAVLDKNAVVCDEEILSLVAKISDELSDNGRILLRKSGTEPKVRIMVEAQSQALCKEKAESVYGLIEKLKYTVK